MPFNINDFRSQLTYGGARFSHFQVQIQNPVNSLGDIKVPFMVKASQLPQSTVGMIEIPYFGRKIKEAGDRTYDAWTVTVINDEDFLIKNALEEWSHAINSPVGNVRRSPLYQSEAQVTQYSKAGLPIRTYSFRNIWPADLTAIDVAWDNTDAIEEFQVTFQYDYWEVTGGITGNAGGVA